MTVIRQSIVVPFGYDVHFTWDVFAPANPLLASVLRRGAAASANMICVLDQGVCDAHQQLPQQIRTYCRANSLSLACPPLILPGGEAVKNSYEYVQLVQQAISDYGLCRHSFVVAVGGGALLDMAGFAAATAHRGVRLIRIPTTVLSQGDSGVGVKNGINAFGKKNFLGAFAPPHAVLNDFRFLLTLSDRDWRSGIAEAIKVALIKDSAFFEFLEREASALA